MDVQEAVLRELRIDGTGWLLGQGTIYPDTIESGGTNASTALIKTHHNRCEEIRKLILEGKVIEPLAEFYKDEVRQIGAELGLDPSIVSRWPFPGPGLAIRVLCANAVRPLVAEGLNERFSGYQAVHFPLRSVGVQGDGRTYREVIALRGPLKYSKLHEISTALCNSSRKYNRAIALISGNVDDLTISSIKPATLNVDRVELLRTADHIARSIMEKEGITSRVWQFPTVLIPVSFHGGESVVLRPINSQDGMTANFARLTIRVLKRMAHEIAALDGIDAVFLDVTDKPPATIEWE